MANESEHLASSRSGTRADLVYDSVYSGAIGGSVVALFFLIVDAANGQPLYTPSLMGSVLFGGGAAEAASGVRLDMVGYYSAVHFLIFGAAGTLVSFLVHEVELHARHPGEVLLLIFVVLEGGFFMAALVLMPGVMSQLGAFRVAMANLLAAGGMGAFLLKEHNPELWHRVKHVGQSP